MVVDIDGFSPNIASQLLDELAGHTCVAEMGSEPVAAAVWAEVIFHSIGFRIVQAHLLGSFCNSLIGRGKIEVNIT